jgi:HEAT repeat protein
MNVGMGIPCTITDIAHVSQGEPPENVLSEAELVLAEVKEQSKHLSDKLVVASASMMDLVDKSKMGQRDKAAMKEAMRMFLQEVHSNLPFLIDQLRKAAERVVSQLKTEAVAFVDNLLRHNHLEGKKDEAPRIDMDGK